MSSNFKPLRRKFGIMTLVLICGILGLWARSHDHVDLVYLRFGNSNLAVISGGGKFQFVRNCIFNIQQIKTADGVAIRLIRQNKQTIDLGKMNTMWQFTWAASSIEISSNADGAEKETAMTPYWTLIVPPGLLAAWLLFSKPKSSNLPTELMA